MPGPTHPKGVLRTPSPGLGPWAVKRSFLVPSRIVVRACQGGHTASWEGRALGPHSLGGQHWRGAREHPQHRRKVRGTGGPELRMGSLDHRCPPQPHCLSSDTGTSEDQVREYTGQEPHGQAAGCSQASGLRGRRPTGWRVGGRLVGDATAHPPHRLPLRPQCPLCPSTGSGEQCLEDGDDRVLVGRHHQHTAELVEEHEQL